MTQQFTQEWVDFCKCCSDPLVKMSELNASVLNQLAKDNQYVNKFMKAKTFDDMLSAQSEFISSLNSDSMSYAQKATSVWTDWLSECNKQCTQMADEVNKSTPMDYAQKAMTSFVDNVMECNRQFTQMANQAIKSGAEHASKKSKSSK